MKAPEEKRARSYFSDSFKTGVTKSVKISTDSFINWT